MRSWQSLVLVLLILVGSLYFALRPPRWMQTSFTVRTIARQDPHQAKVLVRWVWVLFAGISIWWCVVWLI